MGNYINWFFISLEKLRAPYIFRPPQVSKLKKGISFFAKVEKDGTAFVPQSVYFPSIPLHETRSVNSNNRNIRNFFRYGLGGYVEEYGHRKALETVNFIKKADSQLAQTEPLRFTLKGFRGVGERGFLQDKKYMDKLYEAKVGDIVVLDEGYMHMGLTPGVGVDFAKEFAHSGQNQRMALIELDIQRGTHISMIGEYGGEILTERGMKCLVKNKSIDAEGILHLKLENIVSAKKANLPEL